LEHKGLDYGFIFILERVLSEIPKGSILGPLLLIIVINDVVDDFNNGSDVFLYADDSKLMTTCV